MELVRELHDTIYSNSKLIIFCDGKILYDQSQNNYCFGVNDLNSLDDYSPYLCIGKNLDEYTYCIEVSAHKPVLGLFLDSNLVQFIDFRNILSLLESESFQLISRASILSSWKRNNAFCSLCGLQTFFNAEESAFDCECSSSPNYPIISPCIITLIHNEDKILLGRSNFFPPDMYSTLAGFIEAGENAEEALVREVMEEVNVSVSEISYYHSQSWPFPSQLMLGYLCKYLEGEIELNDHELEDAQWFDINDLPIIPPDTSISGQLIRSYISDRLRP
jgi:NAD+ diphosphatase